MKKKRSYLVFLSTVTGNTQPSEEQPMYYENYDLHNVVIPVKADWLIKLLKQTCYDEQEIEFLRKGFTTGFDLEYQGPVHRQSTARNLPLTVGSKTQLWNKLMKEVKVMRVDGPYDEIPFDDYIQSLIGLVPKVGGDGNRTRLIFHLSHEFKEEQLQSVNYFIPREHCSVKYKDLDFAIRAYLRVLEGGIPIHNQSRNANECRWRNNFDRHRKLNRIVSARKSDLQNAFRFVRTLGMEAQDPISGKWKFFIDKCLPFGASISCSHFQRFSNALCHIFESRTGTTGQVTNYLDNFLFLALTMLACNTLIQAFLNLCSELGIPVSIDFL